MTEDDMPVTEATIDVTMEEPMTNPFDDADAQFLVLMNDEEQRAFWPRTTSRPLSPSAVLSTSDARFSSTNGTRSISAPSRWVLPSATHRVQGRYLSTSRRSAAVIQGRPSDNRPIVSLLCRKVEV